MPSQLLLPLHTFPQEKETDLTVSCNLKYMIMLYVYMFDILGYSSTHPKVNILQNWDFCWYHFCLKLQYSYSFSRNPDYNQGKSWLWVWLYLNYKRKETEAWKCPSNSLGLFTSFSLALQTVWILLTNAELLPSAPCILMRIMLRIFIIALWIYSLLIASSSPTHVKREIIKKESKL